MVNLVVSTVVDLVADLVEVFSVGRLDGGVLSICAGTVVDLLTPAHLWLSQLGS